MTAILQILAVIALQCILTPGYVVPRDTLILHTLVGSTWESNNELFPALPQILVHGVPASLQRTLLLLVGCLRQLLIENTVLLLVQIDTSDAVAASAAALEEPARCAVDTVAASDEGIAIGAVNAMRAELAAVNMVTIDATFAEMNVRAVLTILIVIG